MILEKSPKVVGAPFPDTQGLGQLLRALVFLDNPCLWPERHRTFLIITADGWDRAFL